MECVKNYPLQAAAFRYAGIKHVFLQVGRPAQSRRKPGKNPDLINTETTTARPHLLRLRTSKYRPRGV